MLTLRSHVSALAFLILASGGVMRVAQPQPAARSLSPEAAVVAYCAAWNTVDRAGRDRLLAQVWASDGVYSDPNPTLTTGRVALSDTISALQHRYPGARFRCSAPQTHHGFMRVAWVFVRPDKTEVARGTDFYELAGDGRIRRVVGFFGAPPVVSP